MSEEADYLYALEMQNRWNAEAKEGSDSDVSEIKDFTMPAPSKKPLRIVKRSNPRSNLDEEFLNRTQNLVHPQWEILDPTPDVYSLFGAFDSKFFQGRLKCVTLEWSKKMYSCAGICYSRRNRFGMDVTIRLSEPLLKLRPRKDLIETMLHEMIHAYCFVLNIREGNGGHGPNFKKIMYGINKVAGTNITVYHTFHDEVEVYKQHWWRCNGSCQNRSPFFGYVKRTCNRAPSPNDQWWAAHLESCGGTFMKIRGPEKSKKENIQKKGKATTPAGTDLRKFFKTNTENSPKTFGANINGISSIKLHSKGPIKINGGGTMLINPKTKRAPNTQSSENPSAASSIAAAFPPTSYPGLSTDPFNSNTNSPRTSAFALPGGNLRNVMSLRDLNADGSSGNPGRVSASKSNAASTNAMLGRGYALDSQGLESPRNTILKATTDGHVDRNHLRNIWANRFGASIALEESIKACSNSELNLKSDSGKNRRCDNNDNNRDSSAGDSKRRRLSTDIMSTNTNAVYVVDDDKNTNSNWHVLDDEVMLRDQPVETIAIISDDDDEGEDNYVRHPNTNRKPMTSDQRQQAIKKEIVDEDETMVIKDEDIILIDDEYNDNEDLLNISAVSELADTSVIDEFFGEDTLLKDFKRENDVVPAGSRQVPNPDNDIITCPICQGKMKRCLFGEHLNGCTGIAVKILLPKHALKKLSATSREAKPTRPTRAPRKSVKDVLRNAGYTTEDLQNISSLEEAEDEADYLSSSGTSLNISPPNPQANSTSIHDLTGLDGETKLHRQRSIYKTTIQCPKCAQEVEQSEINDHLDDCLTN